MRLVGVDGRIHNRRNWPADRTSREWFLYEGHFGCTASTHEWNGKGSQGLAIQLLETRPGGRSLPVEGICQIRVENTLTTPHP